MDNREVDEYIRKYGHHPPTCTCFDCSGRRLEERRLSKQLENRRLQRGKVLRLIIIAIVLLLFATLIWLLWPGRIV